MGLVEMASNNSVWRGMDIMITIKLFLGNLPVLVFMMA